MRERKQVIKKLSVLFLNVMMIFTMMPSMAFAAETDRIETEAAAIEINDGETTGLKAIHIDGDVETIAKVDGEENTYDVVLGPGTEKVTLTYETKEGHAVGTQQPFMNNPAELPANKNIAASHQIDISTKEKNVKLYTWYETEANRYKSNDGKYSIHFYVAENEDGIRLPKNQNKVRKVFLKNEEAKIFPVRAYATPGSILEFQWYSVDQAGEHATAISGANQMGYNPPTDMVGTQYYQLEIRQKSNEQVTDTFKSSIFSVIIKEEDAEVPFTHALESLVVASDTSGNSDTIYPLTDEKGTVKGFNPDDDTYSVVIPDNQTTFYVKLNTADDDYANLVTLRGINRIGSGSRNIIRANSAGWYPVNFGTAVPAVQITLGAKGNQNIYNVHLIKKASLKSMTVNETLKQMDPTTYMAGIPEDAETVTFTATATTGSDKITVVSNGKEQVYASDEKITTPLNWRQDGTMELLLYVGEDAEGNGSSKQYQKKSDAYKLVLTREIGGEVPVITNHPQDAAYIDTEKAPKALSVRAYAKGELSYQWYQSESEDLKDAVKASGTGADTTSFVPEIPYVGTEEKTIFYYCKITNKASNESVVSHKAALQISPDPTPYEVRIVELGSETLQDVYAFEFGSTPATKLTVEWKTRSQKQGIGTVKWRKNGNASAGTGEYYQWKTERSGDFVLTCKIEYKVDGKTYTGTSENSTRVLIKPEITPPVMPDNFIREDRTETYEEGQIVGKIGPYIGAHGSFNEMEETHQWYQSVDGETFEKAEGDDATQRYYQPKLNGIGKMYYKCEVTYTSTTSGLSTTETTARICVEITERNKQSFEELNGAGTKASPWEINNLTDLLKLQQKVNDEGISFAGCHFKLMADITLPADWTPIGNENYNRPFSGTIHGNEKTITVEKGGKPLLGFVRAAAVNDLKIYGEEIHGYGLVNNYKIDYGSSGNYADLDNSFYTIRINNVTLKEGSKTLKAGFIGGEASGMNFVEISNSTIEKGVVIGYDKKQSDIGSFAGAFNGRVINCVSYADVYGVKNVGGLVGNKGQAMGTCAIIGSQFQGTVTASGNYVGGILGSGYDGNGTAPNTPTVTVKDCHVTGTVTGKDYVGGILGGEPGVEECWANGIGRIQNNLFTGAIQSSGTRMGAIIGYLQSLNRYMIISGNYYEETCGAEKGIGTIAKVDKNTDGRYYRDDDPLGVDAEKLTKKANATQLSDGSITKALNEGRDSSGNWEQGKNTPVRGNRNYVIAISLSGGTSKFTTNDTFSTEGMEASLIYCDGTEEAVDISEVKFSGYDLSKTGYQTVTAEYKNYTIVYEIEVRQGLKPGEEEKTITVKFKLVGDKVHGAEETHTMRDQNLITWIDTEEYVVPANSYVIDVFATALEKHGFSWYNQNVYNGKDGNYIQKIIAPAPFNVELEENGNGSANSGWMYTLNGDYPLLGVSEQRLSDGATIVFHYTDDYTKETASDKWNPPTVDPENPGDTDIDDPNTPLDPGPEVVKGMVSKMKLTARSTRTSKKNVKVTVKADKTTTDGIKELQDMGYTVKYRYYRSTKKASGYKAALTKKTKTYTNTIGKKGQMYYYKVSLRVYDKNGKLVAKTALKQCKYANRLWTKK